MRKKNCRFPTGVSGSVSKSRKRLFWDVGRNLFLWKKKLIVVFFGVKFTGDYHNVAIIPTLFRHHGQNSKKPNFSLFFLLLTVIPKSLCNESNAMLIPGKFHPKKLYKLNFEKKKFSIPARSFRFGLKIGKRPFWDVGRNFFFFLLKKKLIIVFFVVKFTRVYRNVAITSTLFRDRS